MDYQERLGILQQRREHHATAANKAQEQVQQNIAAVQQLDGAISLLTELVAEQQAATQALMDVAQMDAARAAMDGSRPGEVIPVDLASRRNGGKGEPRKED